jgi:hypothetical protein
MVAAQKGGCSGTPPQNLTLSPARSVAEDGLVQVQK